MSEPTENDWQEEARLQLEADAKAKEVLRLAAQPADYDDSSRALNGVASIGPKRLPLIRLCDIPEPGPIQWLVDGLWGKSAFGFVGAEPKSWKSWLTLHVGISVGAGLPLFGRFAVEQGRVLMFAAEGGKNLVRRRAGAICRSLEISLGQVDLQLFDLPTMRLDDKATIASFQATIAYEKPVLVILDPFREMHTGDENDAALIAALLQPLRELQYSLGCAVMLVHHMGKAPEGKTTRRAGQRLRGSSALHGAVDSALYLEPTGIGDAKRVTVTVEHRDAVEPEPFTLRLRDKELVIGGKASWLELVTDEQPADQEVAQNLRKRDAEVEKIVRAIRNAAMPGRKALRSATAVHEVIGGRKSRVLDLVKTLLSERVIETNIRGELLVSEATN